MHRHSLGRTYELAIEILDPEKLDEIEEAELLDTGELPPIFGRCPVCNKPLFPRDRFTGEPKAPPVGTGYESRAKCSGCGAIICYVGGGNWRVVTDGDLSEEDRAKDAAS